MVLQKRVLTTNAGGTMMITAVNQTRKATGFVRNASITISISERPANDATTPNQDPLRSLPKEQRVVTGFVQIAATGILVFDWNAIAEAA